MDPNTTAIVVSIIAVGGVVIGILIALVRQSSRHDAEIANLRTESRADNAALNSRIDNLGADLRAEIRDNRNEIRNLGYRIENRINLDERVRTVERRQPETDPDEAPAD